MVKGIWLRLSIIIYTICIVWYNIFGTASVGHTNFYYTFEKGFTLLALFFDYSKSTTDDKIFIDYSRILQFGIWFFFVICLINEDLWIYHQTTLFISVLLAAFGSLFVTYITKRRALK